MKKQDVKIVARGVISVLLLSFVPMTTWGQKSDSSLPPLPSLPIIPQYNNPEPELPATLPPLHPIVLPESLPGLPSLPELPSNVPSNDIAVQIPIPFAQVDEPYPGFRSSYKHSDANALPNPTALQPTTLPVRLDEQIVYVPVTDDEYIVYSPDELFATTLVSKDQFDRITSVATKDAVKDAAKIEEKKRIAPLEKPEKPLEVIAFIPQPAIHPVLPPLEPVVPEEDAEEDFTFVSAWNLPAEVGAGFNTEPETVPTQSVIESIRELPIQVEKRPLPMVSEEEDFAFAESGIYVPPVMPSTDIPYQRPQEQERVVYRNDSMVTPNINAGPAPSRNVLATPPPLVEERSGSFFSLKSAKNHSSSTETPSQAVLSVRSEDLPPPPVQPQSPPVASSKKIVGSDPGKPQPVVKNDFKPLSKPESKPTLMKSGNETKSSGSSLSGKMQPATDEVKRWGAGISAGVRSMNPFAKR